MKLKLSLGSAIALGLLKGSLSTELSTAYLLLGDTCSANCKFCTQALKIDNKRFLSRVTWLEYELARVLAKLESINFLKRICIQTLKYPNILKELIFLVKAIHERNNSLQISACINPLSKKALKELKLAGLNNIGIGLDCCSKALFQRLKRYVGSWEEYLTCIENVVKIFGSCTVHLIVGLGENDRELLTLVFKLKRLGAKIALFAFTPSKGLKLNFKPPTIERYRAIQLTTWLAMNDKLKLEDIMFENSSLSKIFVDNKALELAINSGKPFKTTGCEFCTRPFYNEKPKGPFYNYPRKLTQEEIASVRQELWNFPFSYVPKGSLL
jgi:biotin synthase